jgi:hypothetical protein
MTKDEEKALKHITKRLRELSAQRDQIKEEEKDLLETAFEKTGIQKKAIKQLVKEMDWDEVERMAQRTLEEELDRGRHALGLLADTPLGEHAMERLRRKERQPESVS